MKKLSPKELEKFYWDVATIIDNCVDYYTSYCAGINEEWAPDCSRISFIVKVNSSATGHDWEEYWSVNADGTIDSDSKHYNSIEELKAEW